MKFLFVDSRIFPDDPLDFPTFLRLFYGMRSIISGSSLRSTLEFLIDAFDGNKDQLKMVLRKFGDVVTEDYGNYIQYELQSTKL